MYKLLIIISFLCCAETLSAKNSVATKPIALEIRKDSSVIELRAFDKKAIKAYKENPDFNYYIQAGKHNSSWWTRFWDWFWRWIQNLIGEKKEPNSISPILKYSLLIVVIVGLVCIIVKLLGEDLSNIFIKKSKKLHLPFSETLENIHEISFDEEIGKALQNNNFRLAVRLLFLNTLKNLNDAKLIDWQIEKTNAAYLNELKSEDHKEYFSVLTRQFEYVWYGDSYINKQSFENIKTIFSNFKITLR